MKKQDTKYQNAPYKENDEYVDTLVRKATENAITKGKERKGKKRIILTLTSIGAAAACIAIALNMSHVMDNGKWIKEKSGQNIAKANTVKTKEASTNRSAGPLDKFMAKASDEEKTMINNYQLDEIPEYKTININNYDKTIYNNHGRGNHSLHYGTRQKGGVQQKAGGGADRRDGLQTEHDRCAKERIQRHI
ncbi:MAG: hypothetical protein II734_01535 [Paludibacteraceae bacterium]|nr:hypothetical protein [Paludibacteraceae bacterium]